jgi:ribosomal protein S18 acetylase RimI-like enzyme
VTPGFAIRRATPGDAATLAGLVVATDRHYGCDLAPDAALAAAEQIVSGTGRSPFALLAWTADAEAAGYATLSPFFPLPGARWGLYLEELFVLPERRGAGLGQALLRAAAQVAREDGYESLFWTTTPDNTGARALYDRLTGGTSGKVHYEAQGRQLLDMAGEG